jgi:uncharacterized ion transporter superfamily protein YfcC
MTWMMSDVLLDTFKPCCIPAGMYSQPSSGAVGQTFAGQPDCQERQQQQQQQQQHQHQQQQQQQQHMPTTMLALQMATAQAHLQQAIAIQVLIPAFDMICNGLPHFQHPYSSRALLTCLQVSLDIQ